MPRTQAQLSKQRWSVLTHTVHEARVTSTHASTSTNAVSGDTALRTVFELEDSLADAYQVQVAFSVPELTGLAQPVDFDASLWLQDGTRLSLDTKLSFENVDASLQISGRSAQRGGIQPAVLSSVAGCFLAAEPRSPLYQLLRLDVIYAPTACVTGIQLADALYGMTCFEEGEHAFDVDFAVSLSAALVAVVCLRPCERAVCRVTACKLAVLA